MNSLLAPVRPFARRAALFLLLSVAVFAAEPVRRTFDIPAGDAAETLRRFASQAALQVAFPPDAVRGVQTNKVQGTLTAREALDAMTAGTALVAVEDSASGALSVRRDANVEMPEKNGASRRASAATAGSEGGPLRLAQYEVTGTRDTGIVNQGVIPREANQAVRYNIIDRGAIDRSGASSLPELLLRQVSQAANYGTGTQTTFSAQLGLLDGIAVPADRINLRGLGNNQTLVMVNGRRLYGSESQGPDISRIPISAVERIEISPSSGSAIYGANAVAGVVNIVLRKNYAGSELTLYHGWADGGADETRIGLFTGRNFNDDRTNVSVMAEFRKISPLSLGDRGYHLRALARIPAGTTTYASQIAGAFIGPRGTLIRNPASAGLGIPGNTTAAYAAIPVGSNGLGLTPASFSGTAGTANIDTSRLDRTNLVGPQESASVFATLEHAFSDRLGGYVEASYRWADNGAGEFSDLLPVMSLTATHPLNPFRTGVTPGFVGSAVNIAVDPVDVPNASQTSEQKTMRFVAGLKGKFDVFGSRTFNWSADASWDRDETDANTLRYTTQLRIAAAHGLYNPLRDLTGASLLPASELEKLRTNLQNLSHPEITATNWRANGELFDLPGGPVTVSLGAEFRYEYQFSAFRYTYGNNTYADLPPANGAVALKQGSSKLETNRRSYATYAEAVFPLIAERHGIPLVRKLDLSAAMRFEKYDDFDAAHPPMVAMKWEPMRDVALRGQYSEGFQPPTQSQLFSPGVLVGPSNAFVTQYVDTARPGLPNTQTLIILSSSGNPNLKPETSETWDAGVILTPRWLPGFSANVAYFRYDKKDLATSVSLQENVDAGRITRGPNLPGDPAGVPGPIIQINSPIVNISRQFTDGIDYSLDYVFATPIGRFQASGQATETRRFNRQSLPTAARVDTLGDLGFGSAVPIRWRGKVGLTWMRDRWTATWAARYFDSFYLQTNTPTPAAPTRSGLDGPQMPSSIEHDVQLSYTIPVRTGDGWRTWVSGTKWTVGAMNVLDREPSYQTNRNALWYVSFNDPRQRFMYVEVKKTL